MVESWEAVKSKANGLKAELDAQMLELSKLKQTITAAGSSSASAAGDRLAALDAQIQPVVGLRERIEKELSELKEASDQLAKLAGSTVQNRQVQQLRETHQELSREFKRVVASIDEQYKHARLLPKNRNAVGAPGKDEAEEALMAERSGLKSSLAMADEIIGQASATKDMLTSQRVALTSVDSKMGGLQSMFPSINALLGKISDQHYKERLVLSFTVACCCCFTIWYKFF
eukprot:TRINITY_DN33008_c0_g1_i2.p1 TRINITY_DN33008_c0_g1~~TRINITY_DN33008_c0_g1_i2.p1  ORF type:complete len:230 (-),score=70.88 TRINITY_DN33008_c0_g1_i2:555-1244(-)